jgi:TetR/AcrR family transcriptional regulator, transcriptional repressor for nem operon
MRVSKETMVEHREKILVSASRRFRERGFDGIGVADLMKEAGLTHGGFYGHFASKEELIARASERAMRDSSLKWGRVMEEAAGDPLMALTEHYLAARHCRNPGTGCIFPSLGGEIARQPASVRDAVTDGLQRFFKLLGGFLSGRTEESRRKKAIAAYASMIGGVVLARSTTDAALAEEILDAVAEFLSQTVGGSSSTG